MFSLKKAVWASVVLRQLSCATALAKPVHHYVFFGMDREKIRDAGAFLDSKAFEGAQTAYSWNQLEQGKDNYDFSSNALRPFAE